MNTLSFHGPDGSSADTRERRKDTPPQDAEGLDHLSAFVALPAARLPVLASSAARLRVAWRSHCDFECGNCIARALIDDPLLVGRLIARAHGDGLEAQRRVKTVREAVVRVGVSGLRALACEIVEREVRATPYDSILERQRRHCVATGYLTAFVCQTVSLPNAQGFLSGLLADVGITLGLLAMAHPADGRATPGLAEVWPSLCARHAGISARAAALWGVDDEVARSLTHHHLARAGADADPMAAAVHVAAALAAELGIVPPAPSDAGSASADASADLARQTLGLTDRQIERLRAEGRRLLASLVDGSDAAATIF